MALPRLWVIGAMTVMMLCSFKSMKQSDWDKLIEILIAFVMMFIAGIIFAVIVWAYGLWAL